jgi:hypothetical protein
VLGVFGIELDDVTTDEIERRKEQEGLSKAPEAVPLTNNRANQCLWDPSKTSS